MDHFVLSRKKTHYKGFRTEVPTKNKLKTKKNNVYQTIYCYNNVFSKPCGLFQVLS